MSVVTAVSGALAPGQRAVRGLFTGGTFCYEAQLAFLARGLDCRSNSPVSGALPLDGHAAGHIFIDLGDDEYTRGRPHPMIDPALRNAAIRTHAADAGTAVILFDVVLGYGAHPDPAAALAETLLECRRAARAEGRVLALIGHVCGTDGDPQDKSAQLAKLVAAGAIIADSNYEAAALAAQVAASGAGHEPTRS